MDTKDDAEWIIPCTYIESHHRQCFLSFKVQKLHHNVNFPFVLKCPRNTPRHLYYIVSFSIYVHYIALKVRVSRHLMLK